MNINNSVLNTPSVYGNSTPPDSGTSLDILVQQASKTTPGRHNKSGNDVGNDEKASPMLTKFTMVTPDIKSNNEDDELEMPSSLPMMVPMYMDSLVAPILSTTPPRPTHTPIAPQHTEQNSITTATQTSLNTTISTGKEQAVTTQQHELPANASPAQNAEDMNHKTHPSHEVPPITQLMSAAKTAVDAPEQAPTPPRPTPPPITPLHTGQNSITHAAPSDSTPKDKVEITYRFSSWGPNASVALKLDRQQADAQIVATASNERVHQILDNVLRSHPVDILNKPSIRLTDQEHSPEHNQQQRQQQRQQQQQR